MLAQELHKPTGIKHLELLTAFFEEIFKDFNSTEYSNTHNKDCNYIFPCIKILSNAHETPGIPEKAPAWLVIYHGLVYSLFPLQPPLNISQDYKRMPEATH